MIVVAAPAYSNEIMQIWRCENPADVSEEEIEDLAEAWQAAARQMDGGKDIKIRVLFPVVVGNTGQTDLLFAVVAPSFTDWGKFWDAFDDDSPVAQLDDKNQGKVVCPDSEMWEVVAFEED
jgi:hypothetical protein